MKGSVGHLHEDLMGGVGPGLAQGFLNRLLQCGERPGLTEQRGDPPFSLSVSRYEDAEVTSCHRGFRLAAPIREE